MCGLLIFAGTPIYHLLGDVMSATVVLVYISLHSCSPNMSFIARLVSDNSRSLENIWVGALSSHPPLKIKFLHWVWVFVHSYLRIIFIASLTSDI